MFKFAFEDDDRTAPSDPPHKPPSQTPPALHPYRQTPSLPSRPHDVIPLPFHDLLLRKSTAEPPKHLSATASDLVPNLYEGGFKLWECAIDLLHHLQAAYPTFQNASVLELGAGHALPAILAARLGAASIDLQDYNVEVLDRVTMPNVAANLDPGYFNRVRFFKGAWTGLSGVLDRTYDFIFSSDTVYAVDGNAALADCILDSLAESGVAIVAGKTYYFGVGGGMRDFEQKVSESARRKRMSISVNIVREFRDGVSNVREILEIKRV